MAKRVLSDADFNALSSSPPKRVMSDEEFNKLPESPEEPSALEALARGGVQGATLGFGDEIMGAIGGSYDAYTSDKKFADAYKERRDETRRNNEAAKKAHGNLYTGGEVGGGLATFLIPGAAGLKGAALLGAASGLGNSESDTVTGDLGNAALGGALGLGTAGALKGAGKLGGLVGNKLSNAAEAAGSKALTAGDAVLAAQQGGESKLAQVVRAIAASKLAAPVAEVVGDGSAASMLKAKALPMAKNYALKAGPELIGSALGGGSGFVAGHLLGKTGQTALSVLKAPVGQQVYFQGLQKLLSSGASGLAATGKYAGILAQAAARGPAAVQITHELLMKKDPEYARTLEASGAVELDPNAGATR